MTTPAPPARAWQALCALLGAGALAGFAAPAHHLDWQPALLSAQPWRLFTAAFVHWTPLHLGANLAGTAAVALYGTAARAPSRVALAWLAAWPLSHLALLGTPGLAHYGGLSGVLHAGVAAATVWLLTQPGRPRRVGALVAAGLLAKGGWELAAPAQAVSAGWDFNVAPRAHATGALAGGLCALAALARHGSGKKDST